MPTHSEWNICPVLALTVLICETISRKNKPNDSIFQLPYSSCRKCFTLLKRVFIRAGKIRLIFSASEAGWDEKRSRHCWVGRGDGDAGWGAEVHRPPTMRIPMTRPPQPWLLESFRWQKTPTPNPHKHYSSRTTKLSYNTLLIFGDSLRCELALPSGDGWCPSRNTSALWPSYNRRLLVKSFVGFNFPSYVLLLPRGWQRMVKFRGEVHSSLSSKVTPCKILKCL